MTQRDIAVIGLSGIFPGAKNLNEFFDSLINGVDSVKELSVERKKNSSINSSIDYQIGGYLDRIDEFDYQFFNLSLREAQNMDPHQRLLLQLVTNSIENAGYSLREFKGSRTAVILSAPGAPKPSYYQLIREFDPTAVPGNLHSVIAGRISHFFDLRGPAMVIDTACSSSLLAIHEGCNKLLTGEAEYAIVGGLNLNLDFPLKQPGDGLFGTESPDGKCKTFDALANGIVGGEGGGIAILKPLDLALKDGDSIHALIKGGAVNQDGGRSTGITAPSPGAQTEVITRAWELAGIEPETVTYIETHGTGTQIGDPIEIKGLTDAYNRFTDKRKFVAISSLKTNIGHLAGAAGIASFIKVVLSLKHKKLFPSLNFHTPNPHIDFENTAVYVNTNVKDWNVEEGVRRAGVSSFGLSGTNVHLVLEEGPQLVKCEEKNDQEYLITLSAKSATSLQRYGINLLEYLKEETPGIADLAYVLNQGRDDYMYRYAITVSNKHQLRRALEQDFRESTIFNVTEERKVVFMFSHDVEIDKEQIEYLIHHYPVFKKIYTDCLKVAGELSKYDNVTKMIFQYALYQLWRSHGISSNKVIGNGVGNIVARLISNKVSFQDAIKDAVELKEVKSIGVNQLRVIASKLAKTRHTIYLEVGTQGTLTKEMKKLTTTLGELSVYSSFDSQMSSSLLKTLSSMYCKGVNVNWNEYYQLTERKRVEVPTYPFDKIRCWVEGTIPINNNSAQSDKTDEENFNCRVKGKNVSKTEEVIARCWGWILNQDEIDVNDDFFELGGNSLNGMRLINRIAKVFAVDISFEDVYEYSTIRELSRYIDSQEPKFPTEQIEKDEIKDCKITPIKGNKEALLSFAQQSLWSIDQLGGNGSVYNVPMALHLEGELDLKSLEKSINAIIGRHDTLRSTFPVIDGKPTVKVVPAFDFILPIDSIRNFSDEDMSIEVQRRIDEEVMLPFNLAEGPLFRARLLNLNDHENVLIVTMHHTVSDAWSMHVFIREMATFYNAFVSNKNVQLDKLPLQYYEYSIWERNFLQGEELEKLLSYWKNKLDNAPILLDLPLDHERPKIQDFQGDYVSFKLGEENTKELRSFSKDEGATIFMTLLAAWKTLLYHYSGQEDIVIGSPVAGRQVQTEDLIGLFVNTLTLRSNLSDNPTYRKFLRRVRETTLGAFAHQQLPYSNLLDALEVKRSPSYSPLVQVLFDYHNHSSLTKGVQLSGLKMQFMKAKTDTAKFDLTLSLTEGDEEIFGLIEYNSTIFEKRTIEVLTKRFIKVIEHVLKQPDTHLLDINIDETESVLSTGKNFIDDNVDEFDFD